MNTKIFRLTFMIVVLDTALFVSTSVCAQTAENVVSIPLVAGNPFDSSLYNHGFLMQTVNTEEASKMFKLPSTLTNLCASRLMLQRKQYLYAQYINGQLKDSSVLREFKNVDTSLYAGRNLNMSILLITGLDTQMRRVFIMDTNNDGDLSNDKIWLIDSFKRAPNKFLLVSNLEIYNPITRQVENTQLYASPVFDERHAYTFKNSIEPACYQEIRIRSDARYGTTRLATGDSLRIVIGTRNMLNRFFDKKTTEIHPYINGKLFVKTGFERFFSIGDTLRLNDSSYICFSESPSDGTAINFKFIYLKGRPSGYQVNYRAIPINSVDILTHHLFSSKDYIGKKYILLDFWGTWCVPCKETTPDLIKLHDEFGSKIEFVSVAYDYEVTKVKKYVKQEHLKWTQLFENGGKVVPTSGITRNFEVGAYPTFILIGKNGDIVFRDIGTSGFARLRDFIQNNISATDSN